MNRIRLVVVAALVSLPRQFVFAEQLLKSGSFEVPRVEVRTPLEKGGSPMLSGATDWSLFLHPRIGDRGILTAGLSPELARTGRQSIYIEFNKFSAPQQGVVLESKLISIVPAKRYHVAIWGRMPKKNPLTMDQRLAYLKLFVEFFQRDRETQTGEVSEGIRIQPIPGSLNRPPFFTSSKWAEYFADLASPADAAFIKITWKWETPPSEGVTNGVIFFDDATIEGEAGPPITEEQESKEDEADADAQKAAPRPPIKAGAESGSKEGPATAQQKIGSGAETPKKAAEKPDARPARL